MIMTKNKPVNQFGLESLSVESRKKYWTPDGREKFSDPKMVTFITPKGLESVRDGNLDLGWLTSPPKKKKPYCPFCDKWHNTKDEVAKCGVKRAAFYNKYNREAQKELKLDKNTEVSELKTQVSELTNLVKQLLEKK